MVLASGFWTSNSLVGWLAFIGLLITAAAVIGASARNGHQAQVIANYRDAATSWREKAEAQDMAIKELEARDAEKDRQIADLNSRLAMLQDMVTARPAFEQLTSDFTRMVAQIDTRMAEALTQGSQIRQELREVHDAVIPGGEHHG